VQKVFSWLAAGAATVLSFVVVVLIAPEGAVAGTQIMGGRFEVNNGFALRRGMDATQLVESTALGGIPIAANAFQQTGNPALGKQILLDTCPPGVATPYCPLVGFAPRGVQPFPGFPQYAQLASTYSSAGPTTGELLAPGAGPGTFAFCPRVGNPRNGVGTLPNCPSEGTSAGAQGFVQYTAGGNQFGGTMSIARDSVTVVSFRVNETPLQFQHDKETRNGGANWGIGVPMSFTSTVQPLGGPKTTMAAFGTFGSITAPGTTLSIGANPLASESTGFPWTTGMVRVSESSCLDNPNQGCNAGTTPNAATIGVVQFTFSGMDSRDVNGVGNIVLVAGGMFQNRVGYTTSNWGSLNLTMGAPVPSMSRWGIASLLLTVPLVGLWVARARLKK